MTTATLWRLSPAAPEQCNVLMNSLNISRVAAQLIINRGITTPAEAKKYLRPDLSSLLDPFSMNGMAVAVARVEKAMRGGEKIAIFGDYDVDGLTGTAVLYRFFRLMNIPSIYYIPHRVDERYSLSPEAVRKLKDDGANMIITVDCGTSSVEEVKLANSLGMDVIVVDHHEPPAVLPEAVSILNPKLHDSTYPYKGLCAAGVAFKFAWAMAETFAGPRKLGQAFKDYLMDALACAAIGTVADVSPLTGENRVLVSYGLDAMRWAKGLGLRALLARNKLDKEKPTPGQISFRIAPWLNAVGRVGTARLSEDLLVTEEAAVAEEIVDVLEKSNRERQGIEAKIFEEAVEAVERERHGGHAAIVLADDRWHIGVVGIVAAKLVEKYYRPTVMIALNGETGRGSARSVSGFALHEALEHCRETLLTHGGHAMAAGLSIQREKVSLFRELFIQRAETLMGPEDRIKKLDLDAEVQLSFLTRDVVKEIQMLAPFGPSNPTPRFLARNVRLAGMPRLVGRGNNHVQFHLTQNGATLKAVSFSRPDLYRELIDRASMPCSVAFEVGINAWKGQETVELTVKDVKFEEIVTPATV